MVWFCLLINLHPLSWSLFVKLISLDCCFLQPLCISLKFTVLNVFLSSMTEDGESGKDLQCEFCGEHKWTWRGWSTYEECKIFLFLNTNLNWWILCSMIGLGCSFPELIWMYWLQLLTIILLDFFYFRVLCFSHHSKFPGIPFSLQSGLWIGYICITNKCFYCNILDSYVMYG